MANKMRRFLFIGDSISDGDRNRESSSYWYSNNKNGNGYVYTISSILGAKYASKNLEFINKGIAGNRIDDLVQRLDEDLISLKPDCISLLIGINDAPHQYNGGASTPLENFKNSFESILEQISEKLPGAKILVIEPFVLETENNKAVFEKTMAYVQELHTIIEARKASFLLIKMQKRFSKLGMKQNNQYWIWDGIHPSEAGHGILAKTWIRQFEKSLKKYL